MPEPWYVPFSWTVVVTLLSFLVGELLGRAQVALWFAFLLALWFSLALAFSRLLFVGAWGIP